MVIMYSFKPESNNVITPFCWQRASNAELVFIHPSLTHRKIDRKARSYQWYNTHSLTHSSAELISGGQEPSFMGKSSNSRPSGSPKIRSRMYPPPSIITTARLTNIQFQFFLLLTPGLIHGQDHMVNRKYLECPLSPSHDLFLHCHCHHHHCHHHQDNCCYYEKLLAR